MRIINSPDDYEKFKAKEVLVAREVDDKILNLIHKADAVLIDSAEVSPELEEVCKKADCPCVIGTEEAADILKDKLYVEVDCDSTRFGKVDLLDHPDYKSYKQECQIKKIFPKRGSG